MTAGWRLVAFPLIVPWRPEFWSLPCYFPDLQVGVLWQWPQGFPYKGMPLPAVASSPGGELRHYAPGELRQWQAFERYSDQQEELDDLVRALKGEPARPQGPEGPWQTEDVWKLAWQLEFSEAEQEAHLARADRGGAGLAEILGPESWEEPGAYRPAGDIEILDPETARLRYLLWRRELGAKENTRGTPLLLGRSAAAVFVSLRQEAGGGEPRRLRVKLPGCRSPEEFHQVLEGEPAPRWLGEFAGRLQRCLEAAEAGAALDDAHRELDRWVAAELAGQWPEALPWTWELEIWAPDPRAPEGGETLLAWGGMGIGVVPG